MSTYSEHAQRRLDQASESKLLALWRRRAAKGQCPNCGGSGKILWGVAGDMRLRTRPCDLCAGEASNGT
jgi:hypothetical protein